MNNYHEKYAKTINSVNSSEYKSSLSIWRDGLREELEGLIYLKNSLNRDSFNRII